MLALFTPAHRLPAPIVEEEKPAPAPEQSAKPKPRRNAESETNRASTSSHATPSPSPVKTKKFAGTWSGTMPTFPAGNQTTQIVIDASETTMTVSWFGKTGSAKAQINGDTIQATFPPPPFQPESHRWAITPQPDGQTARVHFQCFMNNATVVFQRTSR